MKVPKDISGYKPGDIIKINSTNIPNQDYAKVVTEEEWLAMGGTKIRGTKFGETDKILYIQSSNGDISYFPINIKKPPIVTVREALEDLEDRIKNTQKEIEFLQKGK